MLFRISASNKTIFDALKSGAKKVETRAATSRYKNLQKGDTVSFLCAGKRLEKKIRNVMHFASIETLLKRYKVSDIHPQLKTKEELVGMYHSFPGYEEKIEECGIVALEFE